MKSTKKRLVTSAFVCGGVGVHCLLFFSGILYRLRHIYFFLILNISCFLTTVLSTFSALSTTERFQRHGFCFPSLRQVFSPLSRFGFAGPEELRKDRLQKQERHVYAGAGAGEAQAGGGRGAQGQGHEISVRV